MPSSSSARAHASPPFLNGGGELGERIRAFDWSSTPLGDPWHWPHGLRTAVRIMLTSRQPMWIGWGDELIYLYNDPYKSIIGGKHPWALGRPTSEVWREIWADISPLLATATQGDQGTYVESQLLIMERNGYPEETYYTFSYSPIPNDQDGTGGIICANTDDTERVIRERQLATLRQVAAAAAEARTSEAACTAVASALELSPRDVTFAAIYLTDDGTLHRAAAVGLPDGHPAAPDRLSARSASPWPIADALSTGTGVIVDIPATLRVPPGIWDRPSTQALVMPLSRRGQAGASGVVLLGLNPYRVYDDIYLGFAELLAGHIETSIANAKAYEEERRRAEALAEIDRAKTVFFSNVSHEFRTPLTLMLGPTERALESPERSLSGTDLEVVHRNELRLLKLVNSLLDFSRIEAGRARASFVATDVAAFTRELVSVFESAVTRAGLAWHVDCPSVALVAYVDRDMWEKVVLNLVSNAFKYTLDGHIDVRLARVGDQVELTVADTGVGIPMDQLSRVFERFHRVEGARGRTHEGTGIGLALVQELVRLHHGTIDVTSTVDVGSTFRVRIPLGRAHLAPEQVRESADSSLRAPRTTSNSFVQEALRWLPGGSADDDTAPTTPASTARPVPTARIVVADDNADMREYVTRLLGERWEVFTASTGREALEAVRHHRPDLVVTDVMMPEMNGFELLTALREDAATRDIPVIMLSARAGEEATIDGLQAGADDYLVKPFSAREFLARVDAQLLRARIRRVEDASARRLRSIFERVPIAIALLRGPEHRFELANPSYANLVGRDVVGKTLREAFPEVDPEQITELPNHVFRTGEPLVARSRPMLIRRPEDAAGDRFIDLVLEPLASDAGVIEGVAVVAYDVTDVTLARRQAEIANRAKDEFLAMLGHELRNPLAPILTALQLLRLRGIDAGRKERDVIERQVNHLVRLVDDLLDVSRITRGKVQLHRARVELADIVAKAVETASPLFEQSQHHLLVDVPRGLTVDVDVERLAQVVSNLLTNAAKYTNPGGTITVHGRREDGTVRLAVSDTGIGIEPEMLSRIFDLFAQEPQALDRAQGGLGLGLAIVRNLVELHGGGVTAVSGGRHRGATFTVSLPFSPGEPLAVDSSGQRDGRALVPTDARRVMVIDDNADAAMMLVDVLASLGYDAHYATDGPSGLAAARRLSPEIALIDIGLPVMDGYEVARRFAAEPALAGARLIAITGYGQERDRERSRDAGFVAHLVKPLDVDQLQAAIQAHLPQPG